MHLQDLRAQLDKLASQRPTPSAHRVWAAPFWHDKVNAAHVYALNPGQFDSDVRVLYVDKLFGGGVIGFGDAGRSIRRGTARGGDRTIDLSSEPELDVLRMPRSGWVIVASDRPVLPYGWFTVGWVGDNPGRNDIDMHFYPIDCTNPADDTVALACFYADPANDGPRN